MDRERVLISEFNHRVKNTLATVQSLAGQTARHADGLQGFTQRFEARLLALSRAHDLLTTCHWEGASLEVLVQKVLTAMTSNAAQQIKVEGPIVDLDARTALSVAMALNELAANAMKYVHFHPRRVGCQSHGASNMIQTCGRDCSWNGGSGMVRLSPL